VEPKTPRIGLHALGIGPGARREVIDAVARAAEDAGFARLWAGEHVVMVDRPASPYPYNDDGAIPIPADADWLDPFGCLGFAELPTLASPSGLGPAKEGFRDVWHRCDNES
jgi:alkanesulfonate monooxygenase SsuD/methylene tetrahydromethanopterin reductase-like flavin-dependent oxidoreductase (luciferase family)